MGGMTGWVEWQSKKFAENLAAQQTQFHAKTILLTQIGKRKTGTDVEALKRELADLETQLSQQRKTISQLITVRDNFGGGVSGYMTSFSRQSPKGVWLTGFKVKQGGETLTIQGSALKPSLIPVFLQNLSTEPALEGTRFGMLEIEREPTTGKYVDFTVYTGTEIPAEEQR